MCCEIRAFCVGLSIVVGFGVTILVLDTAVVGRVYGLCAAIVADSAVASS